MKHIHIIRWVARIISIGFAALISIFALDIFDESYGLKNTMIALFIHLLPTFIILFILVLSWKRDWLAGLAYTILGLVYIIKSLNRFDWITYTIISGPLFLLGILFFISWAFSKKGPA